MAIVIPLYKKDDPTNMNNYRPISLLSGFSKIFEKLVKSRVLSFLYSTKFLNRSQFGYLKDSSTEDAIIKMLSPIYEGISSNKYTLALFIDVMKAFDTVEHSVLLKKLYYAGFRGITLDLFKSYLDNRFQVTRVGEIFSDKLTIGSGVPQGSVLGPILFLVYINSLLTLNLHGHITAFADDTVISYSNVSSCELFNDMQEDLSYLSKWFNMHSLVLSEKSVFMTFNIYNYHIGSNFLLNSVKSHREDCNKISCTSACIEIKRVDNYKYLGLWVDQHLDFKKHFKETQSKIFIGIRKLYLLRNIVPRKILKWLYYPLINCHLEYGISAWGGSFISNVSSLVTMQKYALRVIYFKKRSDTISIFFEIGNILPLRKLYIYKVLKMFYKRSGYLKYIKPKSYSTRSEELFVPFTSKERCKKFYYYKAPYLFNKLPLAIRSASTFVNFAKNLRKWLMDISDIECWL